MSAMAKEAVLCCFLVLFCIQAAKAANRAPKVQVFTRYPLEKDKENILQCYVDQFHPPKINITLLKDGEPMESQRSDLSFHNDWSFHQLVYANMVFNEQFNFACMVEHETLPGPQIHKLDVDF